MQGCVHVLNGDIFFFRYLAPTATSDRKCSLCSKCLVNYEEIPCTATSDAVCVVLPRETIWIGLATALFVSCFIGTGILSYGYMNLQYLRWANIRARLALKQFSLVMTAQKILDFGRVPHILEHHIHLDGYLGAGQCVESFCGTYGGYVPACLDFKNCIVIVGVMLSSMRCRPFCNVLTESQSCRVGMRRIRVSLSRLPVDCLDKQQLNALNQYATSLQQIRHGNIAVFLGGGRDSHGRPFFIWFQYHCNLRAALSHLLHNNTPMSWYTRLNIAEDAARGLACVVPRDVYPLEH